MGGVSGTESGAEKPISKKVLLGGGAVLVVGLVALGSVIEGNRTISTFARLFVPDSKPAPAQTVAVPAETQIAAADPVLAPVPNLDTNAAPATGDAVAMDDIIYDFLEQDPAVLAPAGDTDSAAIAGLGTAPVPREGDIAAAVAEADKMPAAAQSAPASEPETEIAQLQTGTPSPKPEVGKKAGAKKAAAPVGNDPKLAALTPDDFSNRPVPIPVPKPNFGLGSLKGSPEYALIQYESYWSDVRKIAGYKLGSAAEIRSAHKRLADYDYNELSKGFIVYWASRAGNVPEFEKEIQSKTREVGRKSFMTALKTSPNASLQWKSAPYALQTLVTGMAEDHRMMTNTAERFRAKSFDLQGAGKKGRKASLEGERSFAEMWNPDLGLMAEASVVLASSKGKKLDMKQLPYGSRHYFGRILSFAAYMQVAGDSQKDLLEGMSLTLDSNDARCFRFAKLNLAQCIAAAANLSEEAYCTGRHGLKEASACWAQMVKAGSKT